MDQGSASVWMSKTECGNYVVGVGDKEITLPIERCLAEKIKEAIGGEKK